MKKALLLAALVLAVQARAQYSFERVWPAITFAAPVGLRHAGDSTGRLFVVEQPGVIKVLEGVTSSAPSKVFLDISSKILYGGEQGLLGLAFHPDYRDNGYFYVNYTDDSPRRTVISRFRVSEQNPDSADAATETILLEYAQPFANHNGGDIAFGPDGYLYIASGDGGSGGDPEGNGQKLTTLLGKILRIDVDSAAAGLRYAIPPDNPFTGNTSGFREEIYAYGLRNPWRIGFDPVTGWLWAGDVGQNTREEIDIIVRGANYGWNIMEASLCFSPSTGCATAGLTLPVWEYGRSLGASITGGYVYRGSRVPDLTGKYVYADFVSGNVWALTYDGVNPTFDLLLNASGFLVSSFGLDADNELYLIRYSPGEIYRFAPRGATAVDEDATLPMTSALIGNYPNPFNPTTTVRYELAADGPVVLAVYDMLGREVATLVQGVQARGVHEARFSGAGHTSGTYVVELRAGGVMERQKIMLVR